MILTSNDASFIIQNSEFQVVKIIMYKLNHLPTLIGEC